MNTGRTDIGWGFWFAWVLASVIGFGLGAGLGNYASWRLFPRDHYDIVIGVSLGIVFGVAGGLAQWLVLRQRVDRTGLWTFATALSLAASAGITATLGEVVDSKNQAIIFAALFGVICGLLQCLILRRQIAGFGWWPVANFVGSLVGITLSIPVIDAMNLGDYSFGMICLFGAAFGVGLGSITGAVLVWLLRQSPSYNIEDLAAVH